MKVTTIATTTLPITILIYLAAANIVSNPLCTINAANVIYEEEQWLELNIAFIITLQGIDNLFCYNTAAIIYICKDHNYFIIFKPYFKPILHGDLSSDITGTETIVFKVNIMVGLQSVKLYNIAYILGFHFNLISALKLKQLGYYIDGINKRLVNKKGYIIAFLYLLNNIYSMENLTLYDSTMATIKSTK